MRGQLGDELTIRGDKLYDYSKLYQSLVGYDEIHEEKCINKSYKDKMIAEFERLFIEEFGEEYLKYLKLITKSLLFSLIPLHDNEKCYKYYELINII